MWAHITRMKTKDIFTTGDYFLPFVQIHMVPIRTSVICSAVSFNSKNRIEKCLFLMSTKRELGGSCSVLSTGTFLYAMASYLAWNWMVSVNKATMKYGCYGLDTFCLVFPPLSDTSSSRINCLPLPSKDDTYSTSKSSSAR